MVKYSLNMYKGRFSYLMSCQKKSETCFGKNLKIISCSPCNFADNYSSFYFEQSHPCMILLLLNKINLFHSSSTVLYFQFFGFSIIYSDKSKKDWTRCNSAISGVCSQKHVHVHVLSIIIPSEMAVALFHAY